MAAIMACAATAVSRLPAAAHPRPTVLGHRATIVGPNTRFVAPGHRRVILGTRRRDVDRCMGYQGKESIMATAGAT